VASEHVEYRHAFEVRHPSYFCDEFYDLLRSYGHAFVIADTAGKFGYAEAVTSDFVYVRLHGSSALYASDYTDEELAAWADRIETWTRDGRDVYVYFDNDAKVHAPYNAMQLQDLVDSGSSAGSQSEGRRRSNRAAARQLGPSDRTKKGPARQRRPVHVR
jgi:uncharacterized protein YecE (DUF72 family)